MNRTYILLALLLVVCSAQTYPETQSIEGFPDQNQTIYAGWIVCNESSGSLLYYNLYSANGTDVNSTEYAELPLILYLEGGPGDSTVLTGIIEIGPYSAQVNATSDELYFSVNPNSWTQGYHLLLIDNPPGTGFSISNNDDYVSSADQDGDYLMTFLLRFYELYPNAITLPLYVTGRSYGGKWAPVLAYKIAQTSSATGIQLAGLILADCLVDPINQYYWSDYAFAAGIVDETIRDELAAFENEQQEQLLLGNMSAGFTLINGVQVGFAYQIPGPIWVNNYRDYLPPGGNIQVPMNYVLPLYAGQAMLTLNTSQYRQIFNISANLSFQEGSTQVALPLIVSDFGNSTVYAVEYVLEQGINVLVFCGQDDLNINCPGHNQYLSAMTWSNINDWVDSPRNPFYVNGAVAGMYKGYQNLNFLVINKAGHMVTFDQPESALAAINSFISNYWSTEASS